MDAAVYANLSTKMYTRLAYPVLYAQHGFRDSTAAWADANVIHEEYRRVYDIDDNVDAVIKQEVIAAMEETYFSAEKQRYMGFHGVSIKSLMDHLMEGYGKIRASDLEACRQALAELIEVYRPINVYFQLLEYEIKFTQDGKTWLNPAQIVQIAYHAVNKTGLYS